MDEQKTEKQRKRKRQEIACSRKAHFTIIQDQWRAQALAQENGIALSRMILVPNAPIGIARRKPNNEYRQILGIPLDKKVILCVGGIGYTTMILEVIEAANNLPNDYILVLQSRKRPSEKNDYHDQIARKANPEKVKIFLDPIPTEKYRAFVDSADVGVAMYRACVYDSPDTFSKNVNVMGLSSGKMAGYLYSGLPVVVNNMNGPKEFVETNECGKWVNNSSEIANVLENIFQNYDFYSNNACHCFNEQLELSRNFQPVIENILRL
jgi:glycosyltransferase involved in cell wall biosynthesis